jgi:hypothetical protein
MPSSPPSSSKDSDRSLARRVAKLESLVGRLIEGMGDAGQNRWERRYKRATRTGDSLSTIDRQVRAGALEKRVEGRCTYVRDARRPPKPKQKGRPPTVVPGDDERGGLPAAAEQDLNLPPGWPFLKAQEPRSD